MEANNSRIAKNTLFLYFRMFFIMGISLYTSRVVLTALGVDNFGVYNIVGGVVAFFVFVNTALLSATQRFLNYAIGKHDVDELQKVFSMCFNTHLGIALVVFVLSETLGLYFLYHYINIPPERVAAAHIVYQLSIITCCFNIVRTPHNASVVAHERMAAFSGLSIVEAVLKLLMVFLLIASDSDSDKLVLYAALILLITIIINVGYYIYCRREIAGSKVRIFWDKLYYKEYIGFSIWSLLGSGANVGAQQGSNVLINLFSGVAANAAFGISTQISSTVYGFVSNFQLAFTPQLIQSHATHDTHRFKQLIFSTSRLSFYLLFIIVLPIMISLPLLISLWLGIVPEYTVAFCRWTLLSLLIDALSAPLWISVQAIGKIRNYQLIMSALIFVNIPVSYLFLDLGYSVISIFVVRMAINLITYFVRLIYLAKKDVFSLASYFSDVFVRIGVVILISVIPAIAMYNVPLSPLASIGLCVCVLFTSLAAIYVAGLKKSERAYIVGVIQKFSHLNIHISLLNQMKDKNKKIG